MKDRIEFVFELLLEKTVQFISRPAAHRVARVIGKLLYLLKVRKAVAWENLTRTFPEMPPLKKQALLKKLYENLCVFIADMLRRDPAVLDRVEIINSEVLFQASAKGRGTIIVMGHLGNWELLGERFARFPFECLVVAKPLRNAILEKRLLSMRQRAGLKVIYQKNALREIVDALKRNAFVGILLDQDAGDKGVFAPFFGQPASTFPTVASLAAKYGCSVIPVHLHLLANHEYQMEAGNPVEIRKSPDPAADVLENTRRCNQALEGPIREYSEQYFGWLHRRWRTKPRV